MALLFRDFDKRIELRSSHEGPIGFRHASEAVHYLRKSSNRPGVLAVLRKLLSEHHHVQVWRLTDDAVIDEVARRLVNGSLQLLEMIEPRAEVRTLVKTEAVQQAEEPIEVTETARAQEPLPAPSPGSVPPATEPEEILDLQAETEAEVQPDLAAGVETERPPAPEIEAEVEQAPAPVVETQAEESPVLTIAAEIAEPAALGVETQAEEPPGLAAVAEVAVPPALGVEAQPEQPPTLATEAEAGTPPAPAVDTQVAKAPTLTTQAEVEKHAERDAGKQDDAPGATKPKA